MNEKIKADIGKKRKIEVDSVESTPKSRKLSIDSLEIPENSKNWNDLPVELKLMCIGKMTEKTKVMLSMCSKFDQKIVKTEKRKLKMVWFEDSTPSINGESKNEVSHMLSSTRALIILLKLQQMLYYKPPRSIFSPSSTILVEDEDVLLNRPKFLSYFLNNLEINTLKLEIYDPVTWEDLNKIVEKEQKKVENLEVDFGINCIDLFDFAMKFNPNTFRLCGSTGGFYYSDELNKVLERMVDLNFEIGRKVEINATLYYPYTLPPIFGPSVVVETMATQVNATVVANEEKYFRLALKEDPNKHIVVLNCSLNKFQFAVVSKDLAVIPDSFF